MKNENINDYNKSTDMISSLIHEYLFKKGYIKTLDIFQEELLEKIRNGEFYSFSSQNIPDSTLITYFEYGNKKKFMKHWKRIIPNNLKLMEPTLFKLEFNIEIYFAIYPLLKTNININDILIQKELNKNMEEFKIFLDQNKFEQYKTQEFLSYCALPYIQDPRKNPIYAKLFKPEWVISLRNQIQKCIECYSPLYLNKYPSLYDYVRNNNNDKCNKYNNSVMIRKNYTNNQQLYKKINDLKKDIDILSEENMEFRLKEEKNKINYIESQKIWSKLALDIINYSFELIDIYNKKTKNEPNDIIYDINKKLSKYRKFLIKNLDGLDKNQLNENINLSHGKINYTLPNKKHYSKCDYIKIPLDNYKALRNSRSVQQQRNQLLSNANNLKFHYSSANEKIAFIQNNNNIIENIHEINENYNNKLINMSKLISALNHKIEIDDKKLAYIFREIRLRIFRRNNHNLQQLTLYEIFSYDLFGTLSSTSKLFQNLLQNKNLNLEVMKLVNCLAGLYKGRNYLLSKNNLIEDIVKCMINEKTDTELRQNCLGTIQKFTLRSVPQNKLIELNVIHYIVDIFTYQSENLSEYTKTYGFALMMNLALRKKGREKFEAIYEKTMKILIKFLDSGNNQILTCINGILYSLLKKKIFKQEARKLGIEQKLKNIKNDELLQKQIHYIIEELNKPAEDDITSGNNINNDDNEYVDKDNNSKDDELAYNENSDSDSINQILVQRHYKVLNKFLLDDNENCLEEQKLIRFMNNNLNMSKSFTNNNASVFSISGESSPSEKERKDDDEKIKIEDQNTNNGEINCEGSFDEKEFGKDSAYAFKTKDKIKRTPLRKSK